MVDILTFTPEEALPICKCKSWLLCSALVILSDIHHNSLDFFVVEIVLIRIMLRCCRSQWKYQARVCVLWLEKL